MSDYEIWAYRHGAADVKDHTLLISGLDHTTAGIISTKMTRNVVIGGVVDGGAPDVVVYVRRSDDCEYAIRTNGKTVRVRYSRPCAKIVYDYYVGVLSRMRCRIRVELVMIKNAHLRNYRQNTALMGILLCGDPVYGTGPEVAPVRVAAPPPRVIVAPPPPRVAAPPRVIEAPPPPRSLDVLYAIVAAVDMAALKRRLLRKDKATWKPIFDFISGRRPRVRRVTPPQAT